MTPLEITLSVLVVAALVGIGVLLDRARKGRATLAQVRDELDAARRRVVSPPPQQLQPRQPPQKRQPPQPRQPPPPTPPWAAEGVVVQPRGLPRDGEPSADTVLDGAVAEPLTIRAASVRGDRHRLDMTLRRDAFAFRTLDGWPEPVLLSVVAAGRPDGERSHLAAADACASVVTALEKFPAQITDPWRAAEWPELTSRLTDVMAAVGTHLVRRAKPAKVDPAEYTVEITCLLTELRSEQPHRRHLAFGVGTGDLLVLNGGRWRGRPDPSSPAGDPDSLPTCIRPWLQPFGAGPGDALLLVTGPTARHLRDGGTAGWDRPRDLHEFLWQLSSGRDTSADRTAVGVWDLSVRRAPT